VGLNVKKMARQIMNDEQLLEILFQTNWLDSEDNYYNAIPLMEYLFSRGILSL